MIERVSHALALRPDQVRAVADLISQGATIPFIARYRKERTGSLDEVAIAQIRDTLEREKALDTRKEAVLKSLSKRDLITPELERAVAGAATLTDLEDLYEKYRPKKRTRAQGAREKGLEPLALSLLKQNSDDPEKTAAPFVDDKKGVPSVADALAGARDILAEGFNESVQTRKKLRLLFQKKGIMTSRVKKNKEEKGAKYRDYFDWSQEASKVPSHRILAVLRGEKEGVLTVHLLPPEPEALTVMEKIFIKNQGAAARQVAMAVKESYKRLLSKSLEKEALSALKIRADEKAIQVFADNLKELLLAPPLGQKRIIAVDPGFRTGCKVVCLNEMGRLLHHDVIHPFGEKSRKRAARTMTALIKKYTPEAIAVGNGTAGRETEAFLRELDLPENVQVISTDESGASIYSASKIAREEFPDHDITVRGAVSIGRRLMDPLAELVKIDPKSIGVGQYQHDVDQKLLHQSLEDVVSFCVNRVGVEVNTASPELLCRVSGITRTIAANLVAYRNENGPFKERKELLKTPRLGAKAYEQAAGFLRIQNGRNPLDRSGIHPESYPLATAMARDLKINVADLMHNREMVEKIDPRAYRTPSVGMPTLMDITRELLKPGRDPREEFKLFAFDPKIHGITDLVPGMKLPGLVTNVTAFGAFVDIGVHQDGLVHISQLADRFVKDPGEIVKTRQQVEVTVLSVDNKRKRISLSMKDQPTI